MIDQVKGFWAVIAGVVGSGIALGMTVRKVNTHDKIIFEERGGLNVINKKSCETNRTLCRRNMISDLDKMLDEKLKQFHEKSQSELILEELKKLNGRGE